MSVDGETLGLPLGVAIIAVLIAIFGAALLILGLVVVFAVLFHVAVGGAASTFGATLLGGTITFLIGVVILFVAFGLWDQELWAFVLALLAVGVAFVWFVGRPIYYGEGISAIVNIPAIVSAVLLVYLLLVSDHFD